MLGTDLAVYHRRRENPVGSAVENLVENPVVDGRIAGVILAAGRGRRMGGPKALLTLPGGMTYLEHACRVLLESGCAPVIAIVGALGEDAERALVRAGLAGTEGAPLQIVNNHQWERGMSTSLSAALTHLGGDGGGGRVDAALIHLVDLPDVGADAIARVVGRAHGAAGGAAGQGQPAAALRGVLLRATYGGVPGHPVLIGRDHWEGVLGTTSEDAGARGYLRVHPPSLVELGDLATGRDVDTPAQRAAFDRRRPI